MKAGAAVTARRPLLQLAPALAILLLAAFLRLVALERQPLRGDEAFAMQHWAERPLGESLQEIAPIEPIPPGVYASFRAWRLFTGEGGVWLLRLLPALSALVGAAAVYSMGLRLGTRRLGLLAALLWAAHPFVIWHAQDARNYAPWVGLSALALALGLRLLARRVEGWRDWLLYALAAAAALALAYQEAAVLLALTAYALWSRWRDAAFLRRWLAVQGALLGLMAAIFLALQGNLLWGGGYGGNLELLSLGALLELPVTLAFGETLPAAWSPWLGPTLWLAGGSAAIWLWQQKAQRQSMLMAGTLLLVPILLLALAGLKWRVFHARYVLASAAGLALLAAAALDRLAQRSRVVASVAALPIAFLMAYSLGQYYGPYQKAVDWRALVEWMSGSLSSADAVIQQSRDPAFSWHFARAETGAAELAFPASPGQPNAEIERELAAAASYATLWTVGREYGDWPNAGVTERWLVAERRLWLRGESGGIPYAAYLPIEPSPAEIEAALPPGSGAYFGTPPLAEARGYRLELTPDALVLRLYWLPIQQSESPLTVFAHLVRIGETRPRAQADQSPRIPTNEWPVGEIQREIYSLGRDGLPAGEYALFLGWYDAVTGARTHIGEGDSLLITTVSLP